MSPVSQIRLRLLHYGCLAPFGVLTVYALAMLGGWETGNLALAQPRTYDPAFPANACACLALLGLAPFALTLGWRRTGVGLALVATILAWATLIQDPFGLNLHLDNLLVNHEALTAGSHVGRMTAAVSTLLTLAGVLIAWMGLRPQDRRRPILVALLGSLSGAYGLTALLGYRIGLTSVDAWMTYARLGPHAAVMLLLFGGALILLAAVDTRDDTDAGPRWLWLPIVVTSSTVTIAFWIALSQRELNYTNGTTQLTINNIAALFSGELESHVESLNRMARHWSKANGTTQAEWEADAADYMQAFEGYSSIQWVDDNLHTRWFWPHQGNEDIPHYDHAENPVRRAAIAAVRSSHDYAIAAPLDSPLTPPSFAVYSPVTRNGNPDGFIVGEFYYDKFFDTIDRRLNISRRYQFRVSVANPLAPAPGAALRVFESMAPEEKADERLRQSAVYNLFTQRITITLAPRPEFQASNRQYLPGLALVSGLGVSALLGLVVNLAQSARSRQRRAERTSAQLRAENEERRRVEARLKATDERLNLALESTQVGVYEWHVESDQVFCTPSVWKIIGYEPAAMPATGKGWLELLHADDQPAVRAVIEAHFRGETPFIEIEQCILHGSGEWTWIALRAKCTTFSAARQPVRVLGTIQNINARKRADEALRASQAATRKLSLVASKTENGVIITDDRGQIEWVNESYCRLTGRRPAEVARQPLTALLASPDGDAGAVDRIAAAIERREPVTIDVVQLASEDRRFHVRLDVQPVLSDEGVVENFIAMETDITARVATEQSLRQAKADADAASRAKSEFLASMSHEIRTPMNGVIGMTSLMLETELTAEQRDYINTIRTSGDALLSIINEILDFSKIESGKMEMENHPFELTQCLEEAIDIFAQQAAIKDIELAYHIDPEVPACVLGDITRLRQIVVNLVNNAVKFTPRGFVTIEVGVAARHRPAAGGDERVTLEFYVTDTGIGIPPERLNLLFKPFSQVDSSTTRKYGGTGLGLAICDRLCQLMGGSIDVQSTPGRGSRFHFRIEADVVDLAAGGAPPLFAPIPGQDVLAIDDHHVNRAMLRDCLTAWQLRPLLAADATEALRLAAQAQLSAAIVDHRLGDAPGLELVARLREKFPELPIVFYTSPDEGTRRPDSTDTLIFHLPKPIKPYLLHDTLRHVIHGTHASMSAPPMTTGVAVRLAETIPLEILLVEDNLVNQKVALRYLDRMGYTADAVANGLEAVRAVGERNYQLVFMDMQMPEMDGLEATKAIRTRIPPPAQPVIVALTANAMQGDRERCLAAGMNDYITKPVKIEDIQSIITRYFGPKDGA
ncbi:MAG TPA: response regulator [Lacunisphaera sp.]|nr:response regulator [Lacunisphaera sp.]